MIVFLIIVALAIFIFYKFMKPYFEKCDTYLLYTGGNGSGKSYFSICKAKKLLRRQRFRVNLHNLFHKNKIDKPLMFSSIPIRISKYEWSRQLLPEHLLERSALPEKCVCVVDEFASFLNQMQTRYCNLDNLEDFFTYYRHYTKGGFFVLNTQNVNKVIYVIRYCINESLNLSGFSKPIFGLPILAKTTVKHCSLSEDIKTIVQGQLEDDSSNLWSLMLLNLKNYDTYAYSDRYKHVPLELSYNFTQYKVNKLFKAPKEKIESLVI